MQKSRKSREIFGFGCVLQSIGALVTPEEKGGSAGATVATDGGADIIDLHFAVQMGEMGFNLISDETSVLVAVGMRDKAFTGIVVSVGGVLFHLIDQLFQSVLFAANFEAGDESAHKIDVEYRTDLQHRTEPTSCLGHTTTFHKPS